MGTVRLHNNCLIFGVGVCWCLCCGWLRCSQYASTTLTTKTSLMLHYSKHMVILPTNRGSTHVTRKSELKLRTRIK